MVLEVKPRAAKLVQHYFSIIFHFVLTDVWFDCVDDRVATNHGLL